MKNIGIQHILPLLVIFGCGLQTGVFVVWVLMGIFK
jgi:hypothetical protein